MENKIESGYYCVHLIRVQARPSEQLECLGALNMWPLTISVGSR